MIVVIYDICKHWYTLVVLYRYVCKAPSSVSVLTESDKNDEMSNNGKLCVYF